MKSTLLALMFTLSVLPAASFAASNPDAAFYKHAAEGGIAEVEAGRMAQDKGNSQQVKDFGAMMVGSTMKALQPAPCSLSSQARPPCSSASPRTSARPSPVPPA